jgi:hypothetical protein
MTASALSLLRWMAGVIAFPIGGLAGRAVGGPVDDLAAALLGGGATGAVVAAGQWLAAGQRLRDVRPGGWIAASGVGHGVGLAAGSALVGYGTELGQLAVMGLVAGAGLGVAQAHRLRGVDAALARRWAVAVPVAWAVGWTVTTAAGVDVERQYTIFGATGAVAAMALLGLAIATRRVGGPIDRSAVAR